MAETRKKKTAPAKKKSESSKKTAEPIKTAAEEKKKTPQSTGQFASVVLFALGVILALMILVKGSSGWLRMHDMLLGLFGWAALVFPASLIYSAVKIGMERNTKKTSSRIMCGIGITILVSSAIQIFAVGKLPDGGFTNAVKVLYFQGQHLNGGGAASGILTFILFKTMGKLGARILTAVALFVLVMFLSGNGMNDLFSAVERHFRRMGEGISNLMTGSEFNDEYIGDDGMDDEREKIGFRKDIEAVDMISETKSKPVSERNIRFSQPVQQAAAGDDGFLMDIQLPTDDQIHNVDDDFEIFPDKSPEPQRKDSASLEDLISKAADKKQEDIPPFDIDVEEAVQEEMPVKPLYLRPPLDLLTNAEMRVNRDEAMKEMREKADVIVNTLRSFGVEVKIKDIYRGPAITRYEVQPGVGVKVKKITGLADDIALSLAAQGVRIAPVPGKAAVGIEIPNGTKDMVTLREILSVPEFRNASSKLTFAVGKDITGNVSSSISSNFE